MKKEHYVIAGIALVVTLLLVGVYRLFFRTKAWEQLAGKITTPPQRSLTGSAPAYISERFPLKPGMKGSKIAQLQRFLKVDDDGIWGPKTSAAYEKSLLWNASLKKQELTQTNYYAFQINML